MLLRNICCKDLLVVAVLYQLCKWRTICCCCVGGAAAIMGCIVAKHWEGSCNLPLLLLLLLPRLPLLIACLLRLQVQGRWASVYGEGWRCWLLVATPLAPCC